MSMMKLKTIKDLVDKIKSGEIDESKLSVVLDNDCTYFSYGPCENENGEGIENQIEIEETSGYYDIEPLYKLVFPRASVEWC